MAQKSFDTEMLLIIPFSLGAAASLGLISADILPMVNLGDTLITIGGIEWTVGRVVAAASLLAVLVNRDASLMETGGLDVWIVYATLGLVIAPPFFPAFESTLAQQPAALISFTIQGLGFTLVSWSN